MKTARIYQRVSTENQDLERQDSLITLAKEQGFYIAGVYREKASGVDQNRPELEKLINDLQEGDYLIAEKIDRISRLPLAHAEKLIERIKSKGAKLLIPGIIDFSDVKPDNPDKILEIVLDTMQTMLMKIALQMARDDYETRRKRQKEGIELAKKKGMYKGRKPIIDENLIYEMLDKGFNIARTAEIAKCSTSSVKRIAKKRKIMYDNL